MQATLSSRRIALFSLATLAYNAEDYAKAIVSYSEAAKLFESIEDVQGIVLCRNLQGVCHYRQKDYRSAIVQHKKQELVTGAYGRAVAQINLGVVYSALGELSFAEQAFNDALISANEAHESVLETVAVGNLGVTCMRAGDMRRAQSYVEQCLEHCSVAGDRVGAAVCLLLLGEIYAGAGDFQHAQYYYEHALRLAEEEHTRDIAEMARVSVGIARGNQAAKDKILSVAASMCHNFSPPRRPADIAAIQRCPPEVDCCRSVSVVVSHSRSLCTD